MKSPVSIEVAANRIGVECNDEDDIYELQRDQL